MVTDHFSQSGSNPPPLVRPTLAEKWVQENFFQMVISCFSQGFRACPSDLKGVYELRTSVWTTRFLCVAFLFATATVQVVHTKQPSVPTKVLRWFHQLLNKPPNFAPFVHFTFQNLKCFVVASFNSKQFPSHRTRMGEKFNVVKKWDGHDRRGDIAG